MLALLVAGVTALVVGKGVRAAYTNDAEAYGAKVVVYRLASHLLARRVDEVGIVPPGHERRPLLVLLHGRHERRRGLTGAGKSGPESMLSDALLAALAELGESAPTVVLLNGGQHSWYHDRRYGRWGSMILDEAIPDAIRRFHARADRVAIGGVSMGGYGALHLAALRPREFCAVGAHSAALYESFRVSAPVAFDDPADFARNDVFAAARGGRFDHLRVWIDSGRSDPFYTADTKFASVLRARDVQVDYHAWPGGHTAAYWRSHMAEYIGFYASALAECSS